ncbi:hypothetical protein U0L90_03960 [Flavobacteriaceae sp. LMIT009]
MKSLKYIGLVLTVFTLVGCSSTVKVSDTWKDVKLTDVREKKVMVISKTEDIIVREQMERDMVEGLKNEGVESISSITKFPSLSSDKKLSKEEISELKGELQNEGIELVLLSVLKDVQEYTKTTTSGTGYTVSTGPVFYRRGYYRSFYRFYGDFYYNSGTETSVTSQGKKYIIETIIYDLTQPEQNQLMSVITTTIDNPETLGTTSEDFSKKVIKELVK